MILILTFHVAMYVAVVWMINLNLTKKRRPIVLRRINHVVLVKNVTNCIIINVECYSRG